jgi:large repetitive protein
MDTVFKSALANVPRSLFKSLVATLFLTSAQVWAIAPVIADLDGDALNYNEGVGAVLIDQGTPATVTDADSLNFNSGNLTVTINSGKDASEDLLSLNTTGAVLLGNLTLGSNVQVNAVNVGILAADITPGNDLIIQLNINATPDRVQTLLQAVTYENKDTVSPTEGVRTVQVVINDGDGELSLTSSVSIAVNAVNDPPTNIVLSSSSIGSTLTLPGADVATLSSVDEEDTLFSYNIIPASTVVTSGSCASGDAGNANFQLNAGVLETAANLSPGSYVLCLSSSDGTNTFKKNVTVTVTDNIPPTASFENAPTLARGPFSINIVFDEDVNNFVRNDITVTNATLGTFAGSDANYSVVVNPVTLGEDVILSLAGGVAQDDSGNNNQATGDFTIATNNTGLASIIGEPIVGQTLSALVSDADGTTGASFTYQWRANAIPVGTDSSSYTLQAADLGKGISVKVTYTDDAGEAEDITSSSTNTVITIQQAAINKISATADGSGSTPPELVDYEIAGVTGVTESILPIVNIFITNAPDASYVNELAELQEIVDIVLEGQDDDGDGLPNLVERDVDTDGDGIDDRDDVDDDNDGIATSIEIRLALDDTDGDGIIDVLDADVGNDGVVDTGKTDANFDGVNDARDSMQNLLDAFPDFDQDQDDNANHLDLDADNDAVYDILEAGLVDLDENALLDDGDSIITDKLDLPDADVDNIPDFLEFSSDGVQFDIVLAGFPVELLDKNNDGKLDSTIDMDNDGITDVVDNAVGAWGSLPDVDGDGIANHVDEDDDGDGIPDEDENPQQGFFTGKDADADGIDDGVDYDVNGVISGEDVNGNGVRDDREMPDLDGDGIADHLDNDSDSDGILDQHDLSINIEKDAEHDSGVGAVNPLFLFTLLAVFALRLRKWAFLMLIFGLSFNAQAYDASEGGWQVGAAVGLANYDVELATGLTETDKEGEAFQITGAYQFDPNWLLELRYADLGQVEINRKGTIDYTTFSLNAQYTLPWRIEDYNSSSYYLLLGVHDLDKKEGGNGLRVDGGGAEMHLGLGVKIDLVKDWQLYLELSSYNTSVTTGMAGFRYTFNH